MAIFKSGNPALNSETFTEPSLIVNNQNAMTLPGTVNKTAILLVILGTSAVYIWNLHNATFNFNTIAPYFWTGTIGGLLLGFIIAYNKHWAPFLAPIYALLQGLCIGGLSALMEFRYPGIVLQSILLTFGICAVLLIIYKLKIIQPTENLKLIVASLTAGLAFYYLLSFGLNYIDIELPYIHENSTAGIIFSLFAITLASLNLIVDFDFIEEGANNKVPKYMEWYAAFGLMVTIIWLYIELLRLLAKATKK